ncbi:MAG: hypothetical protein AAGA48_00890, partial [Myxococcota bacterium]
RDPGSGLHLRMPCGVQIEIVQLSIQRETDLNITDHADVQIGLLPILPEDRLRVLVRDALLERGWEEQSDGALVKELGEAIATLPPGESTIRVTLAAETSVSITSRSTERVVVGSEASLEAAEQRAEEAADQRLAQVANVAREKLEDETAARLLRAWQAVKTEADEVVRVTTRRALEERGSQLGSVVSIEDNEGDDGYELTVTVMT